MIRVIVNADDCGYSAKVNQHIKHAIELGKVTSTTIMANMSDLEGAFSLYHQYHNSVSFGVHLNLTEGSPLLKSDLLLDASILVEKEGRIVFNEDKVESYRYRLMPKDLQNEIYKELKAQVEKVQSGGVVVSHFDSHHHIHTSIGLFGVLSQLSKECEVYKIRRMRNYVSNNMSFYGRELWALLSKTRNCHYMMPDYFAAFQEYFDNPMLLNIREGQTLELMIHPGHHKLTYQQYY